MANAKHTTAECRKAKDKDDKDKDKDRDRSKPSDSKRSKDNVRCFKCQNMGHYANACPEPGPSTSTAPFSAKRLELPLRHASADKRYSESYDFREDVPISDLTVASLRAKLCLRRLGPFHLSLSDRPLSSRWN